MPHDPSHHARRGRPQGYHWPRCVLRRLRAPAPAVPTAPLCIWGTDSKADGRGTWDNFGVQVSLGSSGPQAARILWGGTRTGSSGASAAENEMRRAIAEAYAEMTRRLDLITTGQVPQRGFPLRVVVVEDEMAALLEASGRAAALWAWLSPAARRRRQTYSRAAALAQLGRQASICLCLSHKHAVPASGGQRWPYRALNRILRVLTGRRRRP